MRSLTLAFSLVACCILSAEDHKNHQIIALEQKENALKEDIQQKQNSLENLQHKRSLYELCLGKNELNEKEKEKANLELDIKNASGFHLINSFPENYVQELTKNKALLEKEIENLQIDIEKLTTLASPIEEHLQEDIKKADLLKLLMEESSLREELQLLQTQLNSLPKTLTMLDPFPLADWMNITQIPSFFDPIFQQFLEKDEHFNSIDSLGQYYIGIQPYGFYSNFKVEKGATFKLWTAALALHGGYKIADRWMIGAGGGYWYSHLDYPIDHINTPINSLYLGPFVSYFCSRGYIELRGIGICNFYSRDEQDYKGWDLDVCLEGGFNFELNKEKYPFFIYPKLKLDYIAVFQDEERINFSVKTDNASFFSSKLLTEFFKEFPLKNRDLLIPSFSIGWVFMQPLTHTSTTSHRLKISDYPTSNQAYVEAKISRIHKRGLISSLGFEAYIAKFYPIYSGNIKLDLEW